MQGRKKVLDEDHDAVSHFIWCVRKRPALYNYKLPPEQRRRVDVARIWEELAEEIGSLTAAECRKKWKNLRDTYHQYRLRKFKYKECLEKWRYTADLSFLTQIYQPKLKSERANYINSSQNNTIHGEARKSDNLTMIGVNQQKRKSQRINCLNSSQNNTIVPKMKFERANFLDSFENNTIHEVKTSDISSLIELDEETNQDSQSLHKDIIIDQNEHDFDDENIEVSEIDENEIQFCDVSDENMGKVVTMSDDTYGEVYLYDDTDSNVVAVDSLILSTNQMDSKENILKHSSISDSGMSANVGKVIECVPPPPPPPTTNENIIIGNRRNELDLFFEFLKSKIQNLPSVDITNIQIEFLNTVLRREAANLEKTSNK